MLNSPSFFTLSLARRSMVLLLLGSLLPTWSSANTPPDELKKVGITEHLGDSLKIKELSFRDEQGKSVILANYFNQNRPVILALVYYKCPNLCNLLLNGLLDSLKKIEWTTGNQFELVAISINPNETPQLASEKKANYLQSYKRPDAAKGWHFLTGEESQIQSVASQVGFHYRYDETEKQYAHTAALFVLTPQGQLSRYLYGISFLPKNIKFALIDASNGKIGTVMERVLLYCFHFDPSKNSYTFRMWRVVQIIVVIQVLVLGALLYTLWRKEKPGKHRSLYPPV